MLVSNEVSFGKKNFKYFIGYRDCKTVMLNTSKNERI